MSRKLRCYYAHTMVSYGSTIEKSDVIMLERMGFKVINPSSPEISIGCKEYVEKHGKNAVMEYFQDIIEKDCDLVAFRANPDGKILSGVAAEVAHAIKLDIPVIELPCSVEERSLTYPQTKKYLTELGFYKTTW